MALVHAQNLAFRYPAADGAAGSYALSPCSFAVEEGAFCLVTGLTGCGKSTLLRACKPELAPRGTYEGKLEVCGVALVEGEAHHDAMGQRQSAQEVGFVMQDPDAQIVCDVVWHELAFGLENLGWPEDAMRRRVAEVANFFGIAPWVDRKTNELSAGQKQVVNLAAALALRPRLMLLDEPTAQLDPIARTRFLGLLHRVNRELGITVVMATHLPEEAEAFATQHVQLSDLVPAARLEEVWEAKRAAGGAGGSAVEARDVFVRYGKDEPWVLHGLDLNVREASVHAVVGGNGSGKTTLLRVLAGEMSPRRGKVRNALQARQVMMPQNPKALFSADSVAEELAAWQQRAGYVDDDVAEMMRRFGLEGFEQRHPFDLSAGQQQLLALAKLLLAKPKLLLLDEPTKGLDARSCALAVQTLRNQARAGTAVVITTHDLDVAAVVADEATLLFDGQAVCTQEVPAFFEENLVWRPHDAARLFGALR